MKVFVTSFVISFIVLFTGLFLFGGLLLTFTGIIGIVSLIIAGFSAVLSEQETRIVSLEVRMAELLQKGEGVQVMEPERIVEE